MELRVLGAHNMESRETRLESHLIDGVLALDAGCLTRALTFEEQTRLRAVILSHRHLDHVRDLPLLGLTLRTAGVSIEVYGIQDTVDFVRAKLMDGVLYPDFTRTPAPENPTIRFNVVEFYRAFDVLGYTVVAVPVPHAVPAAGFQISAGDARLFYTGDAGKGLDEAWKHVSPNVLLTEVTFGNQNEPRAIQAGHLTPALLREALLSFKMRNGYLPRVIVAHTNPPWEAAVRTELQALSAELGADILVSHADMTVTV
jgi:ribonuclease BN (tRNA processing enzyme)